MLLKNYLATFILLISYSLVSAQSNLKVKKIPTGKEIVLDSLTVISNSIQLIPASKFKIENNTIFVNAFHDSVLVKYRVFPYKLDKRIATYDSLSVKKSMYVQGKQQQDIEEKEELFASPGIEKSGVLSRGISFGNKQDVFVNSNLNLHMQGDLGDGIKLNAVISDQNIPFQPEGNTQQIQEFDQIFIDLEHHNWKLKAGDILLQKDNSQYMKYFKKVQGAEFRLFSDSSRTETFASASIAKGKFNSMLITQIEGVQGPYRLQGTNGEKFIIIIANSEKVFLDGKELTRGFDYDYTIDYNSSEITFNNSIVITKFSRIRVDFEYTERNYARSVYNFGHIKKGKKLSYGFNFFNEKDNKRQFLQGDLSLTEQQLLSQIGDSLQFAYLNSEDTATLEDISQVLYEKKDTLGETIFVYTTKSIQNDTLFRVVFTEVQNGGGAYNQKVTTVNGRVFEWVGQGKGNYAPISVLPAPNKRQMLLLTADYKIGKNSKITSEIAFSQKDVNLFSNIDDKDDNGLATKIEYEQNSKLSNNLKLKTVVDYQFQGAQFNALDRIREADFERDWNANSTENATENIVNLNTIISDSVGNTTKLNLAYRNKKGFVNGIQSTFETKQKINKLFQFNAKFFQMENVSGTKQTQWRRAYVNPEINLKGRAKIGYQFNLDKNKIVDADSILAPLMNYDEHVFYIRNGDSTKNKMNIEHRFRQDYLPEANQLDWINSNWNDKANTSSMAYSGKIGENNDFKLTSTYRNLLTRDTSKTDFNEQSILARLDLNSRWFKKHVSSNLVYTVNTSRELVREVQFIPVLQSQGTHIWIDYNEDGVKDLDEFQQTIAGINPNEDTLYAKFFFPTNDYIKAFTHNFNYRFNLRMPKKWRKKKGVKKILSKFDNATYVVIDKKTTDNNINARLNPFNSSLEFDGADAQVLSLRRNFRNTLFFNKTNPKYAFDLTRTVQGAKQLLSYGQDGRYLKEWKLNSRVMLKKKFNLKNSIKYADKISRSNYLTSREYEINSKQWNSTLAFQPKKSVRFSLIYDVALKDGIADTSNPTLFSNQFTIETKIRQLSKKTITASFSYVNNQFRNGNANSPIGYDMLQALQNGNNFLWKFNMQQRLSSGLNLTFIYEGRKSQLSPVVHTGSMQISALF